MGFNSETSHRGGGRGMHNALSEPEGQAPGSGTRDPSKAARRSFKVLEDTS